MVFGINEDPYNPDADNIEELICDYQEKPIDEEEPTIPPEEGDGNEGESGNGDGNGGEEPEETEEPIPVIKGTLSIEGRKNIKAGSGRTYNLVAIDKESSETIDAPEDAEWSIEFDGSGISITPSGTTCKVTVKENSSLIGSIFTLKCSSPSGEYTEAKISVEVT